jgi:hypothetical protein
MAYSQFYINQTGAGKRQGKGRQKSLIQIGGPKGTGRQAGSGSGQAKVSNLERWGKGIGRQADSRQAEWGKGLKRGVSLLLTTFRFCHTITIIQARTSTLSFQMVESGNVDFLCIHLLMVNHSLSFIANADTAC